MIRQTLVAGLAGAMLCIAAGARGDDIARIDLGTDDPGFAAGQERVPDFGELIPVDQPPAQTPVAQQVQLERVTTAVPWGRGFAVVEGQLVALSRGRHRGEGGPTMEIIDQAGVIWKIDTTISEPVIPGQPAGEAVRTNATAWIRPTQPPFYLYTHQTPPEDDLLMSRPYCALAYDPASQNIFVCAYAGAELKTGFRKHATDAVYRYDLRDQAWHIVEQHKPDSVRTHELKETIGNIYYPHHDPATNPPPHGWVNGPDGCAVVGRYLYVPAKDNHLVVQYDLTEIRRDPNAPPPPSRPAMGPKVLLNYPGGQRQMQVLGPSAVAADANWLYIAYRTSSVVIRVPLDSEGNIIPWRTDTPTDGRRLVEADLIAAFEPWDTEKRRSGNLFDMTLSPAGELFVSMGTEGSVWHFTPDPARPFYGNDQTDRPTTAPPFLDMSKLVGRKTGCNNLIATDDGWLYVSTRNNDTGEGNIYGTIYRVRIAPPPEPS